jgi:hypothetical protein
MARLRNSSGAQAQELPVSAALQNNVHQSAGADIF